MDSRTGLAAGSLHIAPDSPFQFLKCFLKYVLSIVVLQYILARVAGDRAGKKDAKGRRLVDRGSVQITGLFLQSLATSHTHWKQSIQNVHGVNQVLEKET